MQNGKRGDRIRLLWLLDSLGAGGAEALVIPFARTLDPTQYELTVGCLSTLRGGAVPAALEEMGMPPVEFGARSLRDVQAFRRVRAFVEKEGIDLIHAHLTFSAIWSALISRKTGVPSLATLHVEPSASRGNIDSVRHRVMTDLRDFVMRKALRRWSAGVITVSEALRQTYLAFGDLDPAKVLVVHNGIEIGRFARDRETTRARLDREFDIPSGMPVLATVAVLRPGKGIEVLLDAARSVPQALFLILGDGAKKEEWMRLAEQYGIAGRVRWAGFRTDVDALLAGCDALVHPSLADAFPTVLLEAMAAGLPVVTSNVGGIPEIVVPGTTGTLVPPADAPALAAAINELLRDPAKMARMSAAARERADAKFSTEAWVARLMKVYGEVLQQKERG